jgi:glycoside/pentoside/hexuronide:cation symporter, GPH family
MSATTKKAYISQTEYDDLQKPFSKASIKNYIGMACAAEAYDGPLSLMFQSFLTFVYTEYLGVSPISMAAVVSISVIIDGITDLLMGMITDRVRTKYGKMRHWFLWAALPMAVVGIMCWNPPANASETVKLVYIFIVYNVFCCLMTCVRIPGAASYTLCTDSDKVRGNLIWVVSITTTFVSLAVQWMINPMLNAFGGGFAGYRTISTIFAVFTFIVLNIAFFLTRETRKNGDWEEKDKEFMEAHQKEKRENILEQYTYLLKNKWWVILMLSKIAGGLTMGFSMALQAYFLQYVLGSMAWMGLLGSVRIAMIIGAIISVGVIKFFDARTLSIILYAIKAVALILAFIFGDNVWLLFAFSCVSMFTDGVIQPANGIIISRIVDYGEWKNNIRQEGLCNSGQSVMGRIGNAVATAVMGVVLAAFGYSGAGTASAACIGAIKFMYLGVPAICAVLTLIIFMFMKLDGKTVEKYRAEIAARHAADNKAAVEE